MSQSSRRPLRGTSIVITRPVGQGRSLARKVAALGGQPVLLPGVSLRATEPADAARTALRDALVGDFVVFTSPAAVRFAARLGGLRGHARIATVGRGSARALARHGVHEVIVPQTVQNSEGLLAHPALAELHDRRIAVVGAPGGRGLLQEALRGRGARVTDVWVYRRAPARLDARHRRALRALHRLRFTLLSSVETLRNLQGALAAADWQRVTTGAAVVSSARVGAAARQAGFERIVEAESALADALLAGTITAAVAAQG